MSQDLLKLALLTTPHGQRTTGSGWPVRRPEMDREDNATTLAPRVTMDGLGLGWRLKLQN